MKTQKTCASTAPNAAGSTLAEPNNTDALTPLRELAEQIESLTDEMDEARAHREEQANLIQAQIEDVRRQVAEVKSDPDADPLRAGMLIGAEPHAIELLEQRIKQLPDESRALKSQLTDLAERVVDQYCAIASRIRRYYYNAEIKRRQAMPFEISRELAKELRYTTPGPVDFSRLAAEAPEVSRVEDRLNISGVLPIDPERLLTIANSLIGLLRKELAGIPSEDLPHDDSGADEMWIKPMQADLLRRSMQPTMVPYH